MKVGIRDYFFLQCHWVLLTMTTVGNFSAPTSLLPLRLSCLQYWSINPLAYLVAKKHKGASLANRVSATAKKASVYWPLSFFGSLCKHVSVSRHLHVRLSSTVERWLHCTFHFAQSIPVRIIPPKGLLNVITIIQIAVIFVCLSIYSPQGSHKVSQWHWQCSSSSVSLPLPPAPRSYNSALHMSGNPRATRN